jgi:hypothetical protein
MAEILEHPWMLNPTPGIIVHPAPSVADLARPFASSAFIEEEVLESLHVVCGKQMSFEQLTAELCSPPGQGEFIKAFYYLLDQHRRLTLHENGIHLDVQGHDPSVRTVSKQYSRPVSRTTSRMSSTLEVDLYGSNSRSDSRSNSRPKTPPVGPLPPVPEHRSRAASPSGPRVGPIRRASSPVYEGRNRSPLSRPPGTPTHASPQTPRSNLPVPSRPRYAQRARTMPSPGGSAPAQSQLPRYGPMFTDSPVTNAASFQPAPQPPSPPPKEHAFLRPEAVHRPTPIRSHTVFAAPRVQDAALQSSIDAIAVRMNALAADQKRLGARSRSVTEEGVPHGQAAAPEVLRRRAETSAPKHANKENEMVSAQGRHKTDNVLGILQENKLADFKRKGRRELSIPSVPRASLTCTLQPPLLTFTATAIVAPSARRPSLLCCSRRRPSSAAGFRTYSAGSSPTISAAGSQSPVPGTSSLAYSAHWALVLSARTSVAASCFAALLTTVHSFAPQVRPGGRMHLQKQRPSRVSASASSCMRRPQTRSCR